MSVWFTSDTHFNHHNIIRYCKRPFFDPREMNESLIARWNAVVHPHDLVYHLGDFAWGSKPAAREIAALLHGTIHLIRGNHDHGDLTFFASVATYREIKTEGQAIVLHHYGLRTWHHDVRGTWHLYGHSHGGLAPHGKSCDAGVDAWNYTPVSFAQLKLFMDARPVGEHPQFANFDAGQGDIAQPEIEEVS